MYHSGAGGDRKKAKLKLKTIYNRGNSNRGAIFGGVMCQESMQRYWTRKKEHKPHFTSNNHYPVTIVTSPPNKQDGKPSKARAMSIERDVIVRQRGRSVFIGCERSSAICNSNKTTHKIESNGNYCNKDDGK